MKINNDCARRILIEIDKIPFNETISIIDLQIKLKKYSIEDILNIVTIFNRNHFLILADKNYYEKTNVIKDNKILRISKFGHIALETIKNDEIWNEIKNKLPNFDDISIFSIINLAKKLYNKNNNKLFNIENSKALINKGEIL